MSEEPSKTKEEEIDKSELNNFFGFVGVIIALTMTIAWDFVNTTTNESYIFLAALYYLVCAIALTQICFYLYLRCVRKKDYAEAFLKTFFFPIFMVIPIVLSVIPILGIGETKNGAMIAFYIWGVIMLILIISYYRIWNKVKKNSNDLSQEQ